MVPLEMMPRKVKFTVKTEKGQQIKDIKLMYGMSIKASGNSFVCDICNGSEIIIVSLGTDTELTR